MTVLQETTAQKIDISPGQLYEYQTLAAMVSICRYWAREYSKELWWLNLSVQNVALNETGSGNRSSMLVDPLPDGLVVCREKSPNIYKVLTGFMEYLQTMNIPFADEVLDPGRSVIRSGRFFSTNVTVPLASLDPYTIRNRSYDAPLAIA